MRVLAALALALPLVAVASSPASAAPAASFLAHFTRGCIYAYARGTIDWNPITVDVTPRVDVAGALVDDLVLCDERPDGVPFARFTAYVGGRRVDETLVVLDLTGSASQRVRRFEFSLSATGQPTPLIDQVDVQVCRTYGGPSLPAIGCGDAQTYRRP